MDSVGIDGIFKSVGEVKRKDDPVPVEEAAITGIMQSKKEINIELKLLTNPH